MARSHHRCNEHELGQTLGDAEGQGGVVCCSPWGCKESDTTGQLNDNKFYFLCKKSFYPCNAYNILKSIQKHEYSDSMDVLFIYKELLVLYYKATESGNTISLCNSVLISSNHPIYFPLKLYNLQILISPTFQNCTISPQSSFNNHFSSTYSVL